MNLGEASTAGRNAAKACSEPREPKASKAFETNTDSSEPYLNATGHPLPIFNICCIKRLFYQF